MKLTISTHLTANAERVWQEAQTTRLFAYVAAPLLTFKPRNAAHWPEHWHPGRYAVQLRLGGCIAFGTQWIVISLAEADPSAAQRCYQLHDQGYSRLISRWDHTITVCELPDGTTHYCDTVDVQAGWLTPLIWLYARLFFSYRQYCWRRLVRRGFRY